jgi:formamidopyrimidine-DNA glycosylase
MPELPEVETIRRGLLPLLSGRRILDIRIRERRLREPVHPGRMARLRGATVTGIRRRSKYLLLETSSDLTLLVHLGMTGSLWAIGGAPMSTSSSPSTTVASCASPIHGGSEC